MIPAPNLDDRRFQDLVDDGKRLVQQRCPEWSDHNVSDPGVTLIEAFATMVDQLLYRLNRVPDRHYVRFLDLIGVRLFAPVTASAEVTFWLSAVQSDTVAVPAAAEIATPQHELDEPVVFSTTEELSIVACELARVATGSGPGSLTDRTAALAAGDAFGCFGATPSPGDAFYVGLSDAVPSCAVAVRVTCDIDGIGVDPNDPPLDWQAWSGTEWVGCEVDRDETGGLNRSGDVVLHVPRSHRVSVLAGQRAGWVRCVLREPEPEQAFYRVSPRVHAMSAFTIGATTTAVHAEIIAGETLGTSDGTPGQRFGLRRGPVAQGPAPEVLEVGGDGGWVAWELVEDFAGSGPQDLHFGLDRHSGELLLGPAVRSPDGSLDQHGAVPEKGTVLRMRSYHCGGGRRGNVRARALSVLRTSIPYISVVDNRRAAAGGVDGEEVDNAKLRAPLLLRTRFRAVTAADYEALAVEAAPGLARVRCVPGAAGVVRVLVVPDADSGADGRLEFARLRPDPDLLARVAGYLDDRRTLGARVVVEPPFYRGITVVARVTAARRASPRLLRLDALEALYRYVHPITGGPDGTGWPFGRPVQSGDLHAVLQRLDGVDFVDTVRLFVADPVQGTRSDTPSERIELDDGELAFSFEHQVLVR